MRRPDPPDPAGPGELVYYVADGRVWWWTVHAGGRLGYPLGVGTDLPPPGAYVIPRWPTLTIPHP